MIAEASDFAFKLEVPLWLRIVLSALSLILLVVGIVVFLIVRKR